MRKFLFSQKFAPLGVAALSAIAATSIATAPAQAVGTLGFSNGASDFFQDVNPGQDDTFTVIFSPDDSKDPFDDNLGSTAVSTANGHFSPPFTPAPPLGLVDLVPVTANFSWVSGTSTNPGDIFTYELVDAITFNFPNEDVTVTWEAGTIFEGTFNNNNGVGFVEVSENNPPTVTGILSTTVISDEISFQDILATGGAEYEVSVATGEKIPEPTAVLGLLAVGGLGLGMKRKKLQ
ncbi:MAG: PEP-CTERM sorting domain-containing protein [Trichodesmium sp. MO_231.B1]|nr:PEP-CTERM sorting domain-containing protein [Trichodesmium sp. MO_231.B1]